MKDSDFCSPMIDEQTESISRLITGHIDVSYQPEIIDHEVDPQGFNCDLDDHSYNLHETREDGRKKKRNQASPGEDEDMDHEDPEEPDEQSMKMMQMTSRLMSLMVPAGR